MSGTVARAHWLQLNSFRPSQQMPSNFNMGRERTDSGNAIYRTLEITTVAGCAVACTYCPEQTFAKIQRGVSNQTSMSLELFDKCLATVPADVDISFSGYSEPWLNPSCTAMVKHAHIKGHGLRIFTTLAGMTLRQLEEVVSTSPKLFVVHLFDDGEHMNERFVNERYLSVLRRLAEIDAPWLRFLVFGTIHPEVQSIVPRDRIMTSHPLISRAGSVSPQVVPMRTTLSGPIFCTEARQYRNVLLPNGDVTLCCMDYQRRHVLGNLTEVSYAELHQSPIFHTLIRRMLGEDGELICRSCEWAAPAKPAA
jgi:Iron-sulfur cluster-binding domain